MRLLALALVAMVLAACGGGGQSSLPTVPAAVDSIRGEALPGKLLFVRQGVIWQWREGEGRPLFGDGSATQPAWSPTGDRIAYIARSNSFSNLILANDTGATIAQLTNYQTTEPPNSLRRVQASRWAFYPAWAPDGVQLVLATQPAPPEGDPPAEYNLGLVLKQAGPGAVRSLYSDEKAQCGRSAFSPDGAILIFTRVAEGEGEGLQRLYRLSVASGEAGPVSGAPTPSYDPTFSHDGAWLAFAARDAGRTDIFALPSGGVGVPQRLTSLGSARAPAFSPDGQQLAFLATAPGEPGFDLWVADLHMAETGGLAATAPRRITSGLGLDSDAGLSWAP